MRGWDWTFCPSNTLAARTIEDGGGKEMGKEKFLWVCISILRKRFVDPVLKALGSGSICFNPLVKRRLNRRPRLSSWYSLLQEGFPTQRRYSKFALRCAPSCANESVHHISRRDICTCSVAASFDPSGKQASALRNSIIRAL